VQGFGPHGPKVRSKGPVQGSFAALQVLPTSRRWTLQILQPSAFDASLSAEISALRVGIALAKQTAMRIPMKKLDDVIAYQLAVDFKRRIYKLIEDHPRARRDLQYVDQLFDAAGGVDSTIAEGFARFAAGEIRQFLRYALGSLEEAKRWVVDGIDRGYFTKAECQELLTIGNRCAAATMAWWRSLEPFVPGRKAGPRHRKRRPSRQSTPR